MPYCTCSRLLYGFRSIRGAGVVVPIGSFEDHFEEPMILDTLLALEIGCRVAEACNWLVAWPLGYGFSPGHRYSVSLGEDLVARLVLHVADSLKRLGATRVVVIDGHYGHSVGLGNAVRSRGYEYVNVWDELIHIGYSSFDEQVLFEKLFSKYLRGGEPIVAEILDRVARGLALSLGCESLRDDG